MNVTRLALRCVTTSKLTRLEGTVRSPAFHSSTSSHASGHKLKSQKINVISSDALFPVEEPDDNAVPVNETLSIASSKPSRISDDDPLVPDYVVDDVEADIFGSLASPETREKLRELESLWPLDGWKEDLEHERSVEDDDVRPRTRRGQRFLSPPPSSALPTVLDGRRNDEVLKPSLLYPGDSAQRALARGPLTSVEISDNDEARDHRYYKSKIDKLIGKGLVREALQLYEVGMKLETQREPDYYLYRFVGVFVFRIFSCWGRCFSVNLFFKEV